MNISDKAGMVPKLDVAQLSKLMSNPNLQIDTQKSGGFLSKSTKESQRNKIMESIHGKILVELP